MRKRRPNPIAKSLRDLERQDQQHAAPHVNLAITPRTEAQQDTARANGQKSHGPATPQGKAASSKNALKHGWCSAKLENLPPDLREEVMAEVLNYNRVHKPQNAVEERLVETAAMCHVRFMRLSQAELMRAQARARTARSEWTAQRKNEVDALVKQLLAKGDTRPAWRALRGTAHGCKALARLCREHATRLTATGPGAPLALNAIVHLCGGDSEVPTWSDLDGPGRDFWRAALALRIAQRPDYLEVMGHLEDIKLLTLLAADAPPPEQALDWLTAHLRAKAEEFERRARVLWHKVDRPTRDESADRALFDTSAEAKLLSRYINDAERGKRNALRDLARIQKEAKRAAKEPPARNEPDTAQTPEPEAPAPREAIPLPPPAPPPVADAHPQPALQPAPDPSRPPS